MDEQLEAEIAKGEAAKAEKAKAEAKPTEEQVKDPQEAVKAEKPEPKEKTEEKPVGELLQEPQTAKPKETPSKSEYVPIAAHLELKKELKEIKKALAEKQDSEGQISSLDLSEIAEEYGIDEKFLGKFGEAIANKTMKEAEEKFLPMLQKQEAEKRSKDIDEIFTTVFEQAIDEAPELAKVANKEVIKQLALNPANAKKTVSQLLSETYGNVNTGKKSIETTQPAPNKEEKIDFNKMTPEQMQKVSTDPAYAKDYTDFLIKSGAI